MESMTSQASTSKILRATSAIAHSATHRPQDRLLRAPTRSLRVAQSASAPTARRRRPGSSSPIGRLCLVSPGGNLRSTRLRSLRLPAMRRHRATRSNTPARVECRSKQQRCHLRQHSISIPHPPLPESPSLRACRCAGVSRMGAGGAVGWLLRRGVPCQPNRARASSRNCCAGHPRVLPLLLAYAPSPCPDIFWRHALTQWLERVQALLPGRKRPRWRLRRRGHRVTPYRSSRGPPPPTRPPSAAPRSDPTRPLSAAPQADPPPPWQKTKGRRRGRDPPRRLSRSRPGSHVPAR
mmetsp:Transcript_9631/g.24281  ORF Transcript_9631/g.24281 Transcript_9631/m.24281 type:complete len:294 (-) Transcript_9631:296-1177(-)